MDIAGADGQTQPVAPGLTACFSLFEGLEYPLTVTVGYAGAAINNLDSKRAFFRGRTDDNPFALGREFDGVGDQVDDGLLDATLVGPEQTTAKPGRVQ